MLKEGFEYVQLHVKTHIDANDFDIDVAKDNSNHSIWIGGVALTILGLIITEKIGFANSGKTFFKLNYTDEILIIGLLFLVSIVCTIFIVERTNKLVLKKRQLKTLRLKQEWGFLASTNVFKINELVGQKVDDLFTDLNSFSFLISSDKEKAQGFEKDIPSIHKKIKILSIVQVIFFLLAIACFLSVGFYNLKR